MISIRVIAIYRVPYSHYICFLYSVAVSVSFNQSTYIVNENDGSVQAVLVLSNSVVIDIAVQVRTIDNTAIGEWIKFISTCYQ